MKINKSNIDKTPLTSKGTVDYWDSGDGSLKGFGLRCGTASKTFFVQTDIKKLNGGYKTVKSVIGKYPTYTPEEARGLAKDQLFRLKQSGEALEQKPITLAEMLTKHLALKNFAKSTEYGYRQLSIKLDTWMDMTIDAVSAIEPETVLNRFKQIESSSGTMSAKVVFSMFQAVMNHARILYPKHVNRNPCQIFSEGNFWPKVKARKDCLRGNDFKQFYDGIQAFNDVTRDALLVCLYSGMRSKEASSLKWDYVDLDNAVLLIPDTKNDEPLHVPLSSQSVAILKCRLDGNTDKSPFVFPAQSSLNKSGHVLLIASDLKLRTGLNITVHGLRRSFVDIADNKIKMRRQDVDRLTNHIDGSVTGKHYSHKDIEDLRAGLAKVCNEIERLMLAEKAKVIDITTGREAA
jgi:integrase